MAIRLATRTLAEIDKQMEGDQGAAYRTFLGQTMPAMKDAFRGGDEGFRSHLGASLIGKTCARQIWYGWRWAKKARFPARIVRLFNRGHLEEARFLAMLLAIGCQVYQQDAKGNQFRISEFGGHYGGSGDGVVIGIPDVPVGQPCLAEFKTHGSKSFIKLVKAGVQVAKFEHYVQMQTYMKKMGLMYGIYAAVNKDDDDIYMEIITLDTSIDEQFTDRAKQIIFMQVAPDRLPNASLGIFDCKYCDMNRVCLKNESMDKNCRSCHFAHPQEDGKWLCESKERQMTMIFGPSENVSTALETFELTKERQLTGCKFYSQI